MLVSIGVGAITTIAGWEIPAAVLVLVGLAALGMERPALFLGVVLAVRPMLDAASEHHVNIGFGSTNIGGAIGLVVLVVSLGYMLTVASITLPATSRIFSAVAVFSGVGAFYAYENFGSSANTSAVTELVRLAAILAIFLLAANVSSTPASVRRLFFIIALSAVIPAVVAVFQFASGNASIETGLVIQRAFGTFSGPNPLGEYCALSALILISAPADFMRRSLRFIALGIVLGALVITYSRAGYGMLLIGIVAIEYRRLSRRMLWVAIALAIVLIAVPSVRNRILPTGTTAATQEPVARTGQTGLLSSSGTYGSLGWRLYNWSQLLGRWQQSPILGFGLQTTQRVNPLRTNLPDGVGTEGFEAHNMPVRALVEGGPIMLLLWLLLCASLISRSARLKNEPWELQSYARILWGIWVAVVITALTSDDPFSGTALMYSCFGLTGSLQATYSLHRMAGATSARLRAAIKYADGPASTPAPALRSV